VLQPGCAAALFFDAACGSIICGVQRAVTSLLTTYPSSDKTVLTYRIQSAIIQAGTVTAVSNYVFMMADNTITSNTFANYVCSLKQN